MTCWNQIFWAPKKFGRALLPNAPPWLRAWGRSKLVNGLSKSRCIVASLTQNIRNFFFHPSKRTSEKDTGVYCCLRSKFLNSFLKAWTWSHHCRSSNSTNPTNTFPLQLCRIKNFFTSPEHLHLWQFAVPYKTGAPL